MEFIVVSPSGPRNAFKMPALAIAAARAGAIGLLDLEFVEDIDAAGVAFEHLVKHSMGGTTGVRLALGSVDAYKDRIASSASSNFSKNVFNNSTTEDPGAARTVLVLTPGLNSYDEPLLLKTINEMHAHGIRVFGEAINIKEARLLEQRGVDAVIARGHESGGRVGDTTTFVLVQQCVRELKTPVFAQGGIGANSVAAIAAAGGAGVVLDSQLYLCRDAMIPREIMLRFERLDGTETRLIKLPSKDGYIRALFQNRSNIIDRLESEGNGGTVDSQANDDRLERQRNDGKPGSQANDYTACAPIEALLKSNVHGNGLSADDFWLIGQDICLARGLADAGITVAGALSILRNTAIANVEAAAKHAATAEGSALAQSHGTRFPIVQGAMTRVSDTSEFAARVAEGGALPFLALSLMRAAEIEILLKETNEKLGKLPWGVGVLGFVPSQLWHEQMEVVKKHKPPFALIAGGRPDQAKALDELGTKTYLHVPSPLLLKSFIEMGARRFIFEGKECGGHVGPRSSFVLWESMIETILKAVGPKDDAGAFHILFAGGIHDDLSAAMVAAMAAPLTARGIKIGVLVGTAYLFTKEAVEAGAIVRKFQDAALDCTDTVLLETGPGHSIRCIDSPYRETFDNYREDLKSKGKSRDEIREELELTNLGRLRIASKGLTRGKGSGLEQLPEDDQWQEGMYMIGQVASLHDAVSTIADLHDNIAGGSVTVLNNLVSEKRQVSVSACQPQEGIAIIGMSCMLPKSNDVEMYWQNIINKVDTIIEVPPTHFDVSKFYHPDRLARDKILSKWGGFIEDIIFEPAPYGIPPSSLESIDAMQVLILDAARKALDDAGYDKRSFARDKTSVIIANAGHGPITAFYSLRSMLDWKFDSLDAETREFYKKQLPEWTEDSFAGYLGNVTAGRVANRLDLKGINFAIDAACASSLAAVYVAMSDLRSGRSDVVLLGATDTHNQPGDYLSFSKTHALSPKGKCQTFDKDADGIVISEGIAMLVMKRLSDAERDGDRIYAVIRGIGGSSDGRDLSLTAPRPAGQALALQRAYADAGISPATVELVEAHGTGTVAGDKAEVEALTSVFQQAGAGQGNCAIGSVKTNIGHTKATAGLASVIKIAKALHHKVLPPTINVSEANPACKFGENPFYVCSDYRPWLKQVGSPPRRAGVSAFGFGGTNFHAVMEEYVPPCAPEEKPAIQAWGCELFVWRADSLEALTRNISATESAINEMRSSLTIESAATSAEQRRLFELAYKLHGKSRESSSSNFALAVVASSTHDLLEKVAKIKKQLTASSDSFSWPGGIHFINRSNIAAEQTNQPKRESTDKIAYLFPGQGSQKIDMLKELSLYFPQLRAVIERADTVLAGLLPGALSSYIYPPPALSEIGREQQQKQLTDTSIAQPAMAVCDVAMMELLNDFGIKPDMVAGHSFGEYVALHAAGVINEEELIRLAAARGRILADCASRTPGAMAAVSETAERVEELLRNVDGAFVANINAPRQCIISGAASAIDSAMQVLTKKNVECKRIAVSAPFHSPLMEPAREELLSALQKMQFKPASVPVFSNTTARPHDIDSGNLALTLAEHAVKPVRFAEEIAAMHEAGARLFIEVGPGTVLTGLVEATLKGKEFTTVTLERSRNSLQQLLGSLGYLAARGIVTDLGKLFYNRLQDTVEKVSESKKNRLLYRVNSISIEKVETTKMTDGARNPMEAPNARPANKTNINVPRENDNAPAAGKPGSLPAAASAGSTGNGGGRQPVVPKGTATQVVAGGRDGARQGATANIPAGNGQSPGAGGNGKVPMAGGNGAVPGAGGNGSTPMAGGNRPMPIGGGNGSTPMAGGNRPMPIAGGNGTIPGGNPLMPGSRGNGAIPGGNGQIPVQPGNGTVPFSTPGNGGTSGLPARPGSPEQVLLEFQRSMLEITNRFLTSQENVMLAYLQTKSGKPMQSWPSRNGSYPAPGSVNQYIDPNNQYMQSQSDDGYGGGIYQKPHAVLSHGNQYYIDSNDQHINENYSGPIYSHSHSHSHAHAQAHSQVYAYADQYADPSYNQHAEPDYTQFGPGNDHGNGFVSRPALAQAHVTAEFVNNSSNHIEFSDQENIGSPAIENADDSDASLSNQGTSAESHVPSANAAIDTEGLIESLFEIVSERTGYPRQMLDPALDLEADLGIDSIKRVEILNNLRKLLPQSTQERLEGGIEKLAVTRTLQGIIDWIRALEAETQPPAGREEEKASSQPGNIENVARGIVEVQPLPPAAITSEKLAPLTLIIGDDDEQSELVRNLLSGSQQSCVVVGAKGLLESEQSVESKVRAIKEQHGAIGSAIFLSGSSFTGDMSSSQSSENHTLSKPALKGLLRLARAVENDLSDKEDRAGRRAFICQTSISGDFGVETFDDGLPLERLSEQAGIVGMVKTIAKEWSDVHVKVIDTAPGTTKLAIAEAIISELFADDKIVEIGLRDGQRIGLNIKEADLPTSGTVSASQTALSLTSSSVILVTGGARGITAQSIIHLAEKHKPTFIVVGRLSRPAESESTLTSGLETAREIKAAIIEDRKQKGESINIRDVEKAYQQLLREREVRETLTKLRAAGSTVHYYSVDVTDEQQFGQLIDSIYERSNIDGIIHGAGIIEDAYIKDKSEVSFDRVFNTKVTSALTLARKVHFDSLQFMYFFSSVVGRTGNAGQCDYVAANEALNKLAGRLQRQSHARVASIMWGPWNAGMAPPELEAVFASHGWSMIKPTDGRECFYAELQPDTAGVEVLLVGRLNNGGGPKDSEQKTEIPPENFVTGEINSSDIADDNSAASAYQGNSVLPAHDGRSVLSAPDGESVVSTYDSSIDSNGHKDLDNGRHEKQLSQNSATRLLSHNSTDKMLTQDLTTRLVARNLPENGNGRLITPQGVILHTAELVSLSPLRFGLTIKTDEHVYLEDHKFDGIPVMPMAVALETMLEAGQSMFPDLQLVQISSLDIPAGVVFHSNKKDFVVEAIETSEEGTIQLHLKSAGPIEKVHFRCTAKFSNASPGVNGTIITRNNTSVSAKVPSFPASETDLPDPKGLYGRWLFHGPRFQGITSIKYIGDDGIAGDVKGSSTIDCLANAPNNCAWMFDPILLDSSMQLAGVWARHSQDITVLPTGFKSARLFRKTAELNHATARVFLTSAMAMELSCDMAIYGPDGELAILIEGLGGIASKAFNRFSSQSPASQAQISQPNP